MPLSFVGSANAGVASGIGSITVTFPGGVLENDLALLFVMTNSGSNRVFSEAGSTWTKLSDDFIAGSPNDVNCALFRKVQGPVQHTTTWDPNKLGGNIALSDGNMSATKQVDADLVTGLSNTSKSSGLSYFEDEAVAFSNAVNYAAIGMGTSSTNEESYLGVDLQSVGYYGDGSVYKNNAVVATLASYVAGDRLGCAYNHTTGKGWFSKNGVFASGNPVAGTGEHFTFTPGTTLFAGFTLDEVGDKVTGMFSSTEQETAPPSGFSSWDPAIPATTVTVTVDSTNNAMAAILMVFRDCDTSNPEDATLVVQTGTGAGDPDPAAITTITPDAWVVAFAASSEGDAVANPPTGYSNLVTRTQGSTISIMGSTKAVVTPGSEDPGAYADIAADAGDTWITYTYAIRPKPIVVPSQPGFALLGVMRGAPLIAPPPQTFQLLDEFRYGDISSLGFVDLFVLYESAMVAPGDQDTDPPDAAFLNNMFAALKADNPNVNRICLDYEAWDITADPSSATGINTTIVGYYVTLLQAAKNHFSDVGLYGEIPERYTGFLTGGSVDPISATNQTRLDNWNARSQQMQPMWDLADTIYPSFYYINPVYNDTVKRNFWYEKNLEQCQARAPNKPYIPFMWPRIHSSVDPAMPFISGVIWRASLEKLLELQYDGFAGWDLAGNPDPRTLNPVPDFWPETEAFAASVT